MSPLCLTFKHQPPLPLLHCHNFAGALSICDGKCVLLITAYLRESCAALEPVMTAARERGLTVGAKHNGFINLADGRVGFNISAVRAEADRPGAH